MRQVVRWAVRNSPSMNTLMIAILVVGMSSLFLLRRETFPKFDVDIVLVTVPYPGASPAEVEEGICLKIEEAVHSIDGLKKVFSVSREGGGFVLCELRADVDDPQRVLNDIRSAVDRIPSFPENAENREVKLILMPTSAMRVSIVSKDDTPIDPDEPDLEAEWELRALTESIRDKMLQLPAVSLVEVMPDKPYQIDVEISEATLRKHNLSLLRVAEAIRAENVELPAGKIRTKAGVYLVRGRNKGLTGEEIEKLTVIRQGNRVHLTAGDLGRVRDGFDDVTMFSTVNGRRALTLHVEVNENDDLLQVVDEVKQFVQEERETGQVPAGYELIVWNDQSVIVRDRLNLLTRNGIGGLILVFLVLSVFLNIRLAFWVALGIPVSVLGACGVMLYTGDTMNMISMFAFVMGLGIVVDDAIVIGENIYKHRERGKGAVQAAIDGTVEVAGAVVASVATTIIAFMPLFFVSGIMGKFIAVMPVAVVAMLVISLVESLIILPCHLAHTRKIREGKKPGWHARVRLGVEAGLEKVIHRFYLPSLSHGLARPAVVVSLAIASLMLVAGLVKGGFTPFVLFPKLDNNWIQCRIEFPDGTPAQVTYDATKKIEAAIYQVAGELAGEGNEDKIVRLVYRALGSRAAQGPVRSAEGSHVGELWVELANTEDRQELAGEIGKKTNSQEIIRRWRKAAGQFAGVEELTFGEVELGPGGKSIEFKLVGDDLAQLKKAADLCKAELTRRSGVFDVSHDNHPGKPELQINVRPEGRALGVTEADLSRTIRASYYGEEVMRLQRGRHEVKLMVRYPPEERKSLANFNEIRVRTSDGEIPLPDLAKVTTKRAYSEINRITQKRSITLTADVDSELATSGEIVRDLKAGFIPGLLEKFPGISVRWEGQAEQRADSLGSLMNGFIVAVLAMFVLLTLEFRSYAQPLIILATIPFGIVGAVLGHLLLGLPFTMFSMFGLVALSGVVANDSIVLVDFINQRRAAGHGLRESLLQAGAERFRPVLLTSITTVAGLAPILMERSLQAQVLIPMAVSLAFGLMSATVWVLYLVPALYLVYAKSLARAPRALVRTRRAWRWLSGDGRASRRRRRRKAQLDQATPPRSTAAISDNGSDDGKNTPLPVDGDGQAAQQESAGNY